jgi:hypothetical protein
VCDEYATSEAAFAANDVEEEKCEEKREIDVEKEKEVEEKCKEKNVSSKSDKEDKKSSFKGKSVQKKKEMKPEKEKERREKSYDCDADYSRPSIQRRSSCSFGYISASSLCADMPVEVPMPMELLIPQAAPIVGTSAIGCLSVFFFFCLGF